MCLETQADWPLVQQAGRSLRGKPPSGPRCILATTLLLSLSLWRCLPPQTSGPPSPGSHTCTGPHTLVWIEYRSESQILVTLKPVILHISSTYPLDEQSHMRQMRPRCNGNNTKSILSHAQLNSTPEVCVCVCLRTLCRRPSPKWRSLWGTIPASRWAAPTTSPPSAGARWWCRPVRSSAARWWRHRRRRRSWGEFRRRPTRRRRLEPAEGPRAEERD